MNKLDKYSQEYNQNEWTTMRIRKIDQIDSIIKAFSVRMIVGDIQNETSMGFVVSH